MKSAQNLVKKVKESEHFFDWFSEPEENLQKASYMFSAFVSSARSITFVIQYLGKGLSGFDVWYQRKQDFMKKDPVCKYSRIQIISAPLMVKR